MLNEFESCSCKCNQNLEGNASDRRVSFVGKRYSIARSFAKDGDA